MLTAHNFEGTWRDFYVFTAYSDFVLCPCPCINVSQLGFESATFTSDCKDLEMHKKNSDAFPN